MRDGLGSAVMIAIIAVFIAIVSGYLAFNVNYMKAFNMKNKIIDYFNKYDGDCFSTNECKDDIEKYAKSIGYSPDKLNCGNGYETEKYFCSKKVPATIKADMDSLSDRNPGNYYAIVTKIDINIPIVRNVFTGISVFFVKGNTKVLNH